MSAYERIRQEIQNILEIFPPSSSKFRAYQLSSTSLLQRLSSLLPILHSPPSSPSSTLLMTFPIQLYELQLFLESFQLHKLEGSGGGVKELIEWYHQLVHNCYQHIHKFEKFHHQIHEIKKLFVDRNDDQEYYQLDCQHIQTDLESFYSEMIKFEKSSKIGDLTIKNDLHDLIEIFSNILSDWIHMNQEITNYQSHVTSVTEQLTNPLLPVSSPNSTKSFQSELIRLRRMIEDFSQSSCTFPQQILLIDALQQSIVTAIEDTSMVNREDIMSQLHEIKNMITGFHQEVISTMQRNDQSSQENLKMDHFHDLVKNLSHSNIQQALREEKLRQLQLYPTEVLIKPKSFGRGSFGEVCEGQYKKVSVAVKIIKSRKDTFTSKELTAIENESLLMSLCTHPYVLQIYGMCYPDPRTAYILMELCSTGSLWSYLQDQSKDVTTALSFAWTSDLFSAISHLHQHKVIHRDIKPENILLTSNLYCKLTDFGLSKQQMESSFGVTSMSTTCGSFLYMAPEIRHQKRPTHRSDVYSAGITAYQCLSRSTPPQEHVRQRILNYVSVFCSPIIQQFFEDCLHEDPRDRISASDGLNQLSEIQASYPDPRSSLQLSPSRTQSDSMESTTTTDSLSTASLSLFNSSNSYLDQPSEIRSWLEKFLGGYAGLSLSYLLPGNIISGRFSEESLEIYSMLIVKQFHSDGIFTLVELLPHINYYSLEFFIDLNIPRGIAHQLVMSLNSEVVKLTTKGSQGDMTDTTRSAPPMTVSEGDDNTIDEWDLESYFSASDLSVSDIDNSQRADDNLVPSADAIEPFVPAMTQSRPTADTVEYRTESSPRGGRGYRQWKSLPKLENLKPLASSRAFPGFERDPFQERPGGSGRYHVRSRSRRE